MRSFHLFATFPILWTHIPFSEIHVSADYAIEIHRLDPDLGQRTFLKRRVNEPRNKARYSRREQENFPIYYTVQNRPSFLFINRFAYMLCPSRALFWSVFDAALDLTIRRKASWQVCPGPEIKEVQKPPISDIKNTKFFNVSHEMIVRKSKAQQIYI